MRRFDSASGFPLTGGTTMTDDGQRYRLSRRRVLAGLGGVGLASAAAGLGTSAYFNDTESFENNTLTAGTLDLKVDWEEHYSYPQIYGFDDPTVELDVTRSEPSDTEGYVALPDPENPAVWVAEDHLGTYMDNTAIEAYPDTDNDGVQDDFNTDDVGDVCTDGADMDGDLDPSGLRTSNADTTGDVEGHVPLVDLDDVKPGDFGELTLSFHLCDNPGYIWLNGELVDASENGVTEPEGESEAEEEDVVELLDEVETTIWHDGDCDNVFEPGGDSGEEGEPADVVLVIDRSGSMSGQMSQVQSGAKDLVDALGPNDQVGLVSFADDSSHDAGLTFDHNSVKGEIDNISSGGGTNMEAGVEQAHEELSVGDTFSGTPYPQSGNARSSARKIMIFLGDGTENESTDITDSASNESPSEEATNAKDDGIEIFTIAYGNPGGSAETTLEDMASDPEADHYFEADISEIQDLLESLGGTVGSSGEEVIFRGSLRQALNELSTGDGIPIDAEPGSEGRSCFPGLQTSCVGFAWHLPAEVGNQVQSDTVSFDLGFYAEQCRNNDGAATEAET